jgi:hypothetical protein
LKIDPLAVCWSVFGCVAGCGDAAEVAVFESVAVSFEGDDFGVVDTVDHGGGDHVVAEDFAPAAEDVVGGDDQAGAFVSAGDEWKNRLAASGSKGM